MRSKPKKIACASSRWKKPTAGNRTSRVSRIPLKLSRIANWHRFRGRNRPPWRPKPRKKPLGSGTRTRRGRNYSELTTWKTWSMLKNSRLPSNASSTRWRGRTARDSRLKRNWHVRQRNKQRTRLMCKGWSVRSSSSSIDWRIQNCSRKPPTMS